MGNGVAELNANLFTRIESFPKAKTELVDFHIKHAVEDYIAAIEPFDGLKMVVSATDDAEATSYIRRAAVLSDLVVLRVASHLGRPAIGLLPISDDIASPVLGASEAIDPVTHKRRFATPAEYMWGMSLMAMIRADSSSTVQLLGRPFDSLEEPSWHRTLFSRTSQKLTNARGEKCHIAAGAIHVQIPKDSRLLEEAEGLLRQGRLAYAPFLSLPVQASGLAEGVLKAGLIRARFGILESHMSPKASKLMWELDIPYLEAVPLSILSQILSDEGESLSAFRRELRRAVDDVDFAKDDSEVSKRVIKFKRDVLEDELEKVRRALGRVSRMNSVARIGAYLSVGSLAIAATIGHTPASMIIGGTGFAAASLSALWRNHEDALEARRSPMHFVWRMKDQLSRRS